MSRPKTTRHCPITLFESISQGCDQFPSFALICDFDFPEYWVAVKFLVRFRFFTWFEIATVDRIERELLRSIQLSEWIARATGEKTQKK